MSIQVEVLGDVFPRRPTTFEVYRPHMVHFLHNRDNNGIEHLDIVATWKGISHEQAVELLFWERAFQKSLESLIKETLIADFVQADPDAGAKLP